MFRKTRLSTGQGDRRVEKCMGNDLEALQVVAPTPEPDHRNCARSRFNQVDREATPDLEEAGAGQGW